MGGGGGGLLDAQYLHSIAQVGEVRREEGGLEENISSTNVEVKKQDKQAYTLKLTVTHTETRTTDKAAMKERQADAEQEERSRNAIWEIPLTPSGNLHHVQRQLYPALRPQPRGSVGITGGHSLHNEVARAGERSCGTISSAHKRLL